MFIQVRSEGELLKSLVRTVRVSVFLKFRYIESTIVAKYSTLITGINKNYAY